MTVRYSRGSLARRVDDIEADAASEVSKSGHAKGIKLTKEIIEPEVGVCECV